MTSQDSDLRDRRAADLAVDFYNLCLRIAEKRGIVVVPSRAQFYELAVRYLIDAERFSADEPDGVRPSKHVGFIAFWIRKLKPIGFAYSADGDEIVDINEQFALFVAFEMLSDFARASQIIIHDIDADTNRTLVYDEKRFRRCIDRFCGQKVDLNGIAMFDRLVRDLRFRTFGPHHLVHLFDQFVFWMFSDSRRRAMATVG